MLSPSVILLAVVTPSHYGRNCCQKSDVKIEETDVECDLEELNNVIVKVEDELVSMTEKTKTDQQKDASGNEGCDDPDSDVKASRTENRTSEMCRKPDSINDLEDPSLSDDDFSNGDNDTTDDWQSSPKKRKQPKRGNAGRPQSQTSSKLTTDQEIPLTSNKLKVVPKICLRPAGTNGRDSDDLLHCIECSRAYESDCPEHGHLLIIEDVFVPPDANDKFRAKKTAPRQVTVADSKIPGAGSGVWAREVIPARTRFGPYEGEIVPADRCSSYAWVIRKDGAQDYCVDASKPGLSNWMRFVNCARHDGEQNLHAFQYQGKIYYRTIQRVVPNEELLVWYGNDYGRLLGIDISKGSTKNEEASFQCPTCVYAFSSPLYLEAHKKFCRQRHLQSSLNSSLLPKKKRKRNSIDAPMRKCPKCTKKFTDAEALMRHAKTHRDIELLSCPECDKTFLRKCLLTVHLRRHRGDKPFVCAECDMRFVQISHLTSHLLTHSKERAYECKECNKRFSRKDHLNGHLRIHRDDRRFVCQKCNKRFIRNGELMRHMETHSDAKPFPCPQCSKSFALVEYLKKHSIVHTGEKRFRCSECDMRFAHRRTLKQHLRSHFGEKPYVCTECQERFSLPKTLLNHMKRHGQTQRFECKECKKCYSQKRSYEKHLSIHERGKAVNRCAECGGVFSSPQNLRRHFAIHNGEKRFDCKICDKRFARKETLQKHERSHRGTANFVFVDCDDSTREGTPEPEPSRFDKD